jgi:hypothetical protein
MLDTEWRPTAIRQQHPMVEDPTLLFKPMGWHADDWQIKLLKSTHEQQLVCVSRQAGKSLTAGVKALTVALTRPKSTTVIVSRSQNQASEVLRKVKELHSAWREQKTTKAVDWRPRPVRLLDEAERETEARQLQAVTNSVMSFEIGNGSRILSKPCSANTTIGYTIDLLILDEAARIPDEVYAPLRPMLAIARSKGRGNLLVLSTPNGKRGWFWDAWKKAEEDEANGIIPAWERTRVTARQCPRISQKFLDDELRDIGVAWWRQEYDCLFADSIGQVFSQDSIDRALRTVDDLPILEEDV